MAERRSGLLACAGLLALLTGCVERRFVIDSSPRGAKVYVNDRAVGFTPVDVPFTYYGTYRITLELDGHQTRHIDQRVVAPWYAYPPVDFVAENLNPFTTRDIRPLKYDLAPLPRPNLDELRLQAEDLRRQGKELPEPTIPVTPRNPRPDAAPPPGPAVPRPGPAPVLPPPDPVP